MKMGSYTQGTVPWQQEISRKNPLLQQDGGRTSIPVKYGTVTLKCLHSPSVFRLSGPAWNRLRNSLSKPATCAKVAEKWIDSGMEMQYKGLSFSANEDNHL
jgi:hypothetical protein